ncbi:MBL fold metallo-hydrolase [Candidatus Saganbacteria bacterium CG08_land_8_20_14_0_20_45_16]|uniref:MBL fold metallo-hydrolase n=1 Tax=Candidatus Saganbacteria bacterium CG08_land_8_20_14_0_20_45_16 TaxID=2014293 RepID=A0A2H0XV94_UNCSA|nr:MAG: MBL fold metallo-hydrolase [Candidatus Saganbacteria bacterium CG08_land_8_20_14_0_20_45_16]
MEIKTIKVGMLQTNCYILIDDKSNEAVVIDPGDEAEKILPELEGLIVKFVLLTHAHYDHVGALEAVLRATGAPLRKDEEEITFGQETLTVIKTPGHTSDGVCFYAQAHNYLFAGDTLFYGMYGRTDLPTSSPREMVLALKKLAELPPETNVFSGHGRPTTIKQEKEFGTIG